MPEGLEEKIKEFGSDGVNSAVKIQEKAGRSKALKEVSIPRNKNLTWEETIVHYADYRVFQNNVVTLTERLEYLQEAYQRPPELWQKRTEHLQEIEQNIMQIIKMKPEDLAEAIQNGR